MEDLITVNSVFVEADSEIMLLQDRLKKYFGSRTDQTPDFSPNKCLDCENPLCTKTRLRSIYTVDVVPTCLQIQDSRKTFYSQTTLEASGSMNFRRMR